MRAYNTFHRRQSNVTSAYALRKGSRFVSGTVLREPRVELQKRMRAWGGFSCLMHSVLSAPQRHEGQR